MARVTGSVAPFVGGWGWEHGRAVADLVALGRVGAAVAGLRVGDVYRWCGERGAWRRLWG